MTRPAAAIGRVHLPEGPADHGEESLLRIPMVRHALADPQVRWTPRGIDRSWTYEGVVPASVVGFNPFSRRVFYGASSRLARWLRQPSRSARALNAGDFLVHELLFAVHDYLHVWGYLAICHLEPSLGLGTAPITEDSVETLAFCHVVTEAAATCFDYWYLSTVRLAEVCDIGTCLRGPLTVDYHEDDADEFRRFYPRLEVQTPRFFRQLVRLHCEGVIEGFDARDVDRSPRLQRWMRHELLYARTARHGIRGWLAHLAGGALRSRTETELGAPIRISAPWQRDLVDRVGELLWEKMKGGVLHRFRPALPARRVWRAPPSAPRDYRYLNARAVPPRGEIVPDSFEWLAWQTMSARHLASVDPRALRLFEAAIARREVDLLELLLGRSRAVEGAGREPAEMFFPN